MRINSAMREKEARGDRLWSEPALIVYRKVPFMPFVRRAKVIYWDDDQAGMYGVLRKAAMNRKEISEIRRRFNPDRNAIAAIRGCYVDEKREIVSMFNRPLVSIPQEELEKYMAIFRRTLSGLPGRNLVDMTFRPDQVMEGEEHRLLSALRNTSLKVEEGVQAFYRKVIDSMDLEGNFLILLASDAYDVPFRTQDPLKTDDGSDEVFDYFLCSICPVKLSKPALSYCAEDNDFHDRELDWIVAGPELGFMFPSFEDRAANIYSALYYTRDAENMHEDFIAAVFNTDAPMSAAAQKETFDALLEDTVAEDLSLDVLESVHEQIRERIDEQKSDKDAAAPVITKAEIRNALQSCGVPDERVSAFEQRYDEDFGPAADLSAQNLVDLKQIEVRTPDVRIHVDPGHGDLLETRVIDGVRYILIRADDHVTVNGVSIAIREEPQD